MSTVADQDNYGERGIGEFESLAIKSGLWWFVVVCGGLRGSLGVCGGLQSFVVVFGGL